MYFFKYFYYNVVKSLKITEFTILGNKKGYHLKRKFSVFLENVGRQNETDRKIKPKQTIAKNTTDKRLLEVRVGYRTNCRIIKIKFIQNS